MNHGISIYVRRACALLFIFSSILHAKPIFDSSKFFERLTHNFGEVEKGKCYRFWQLKPAKLDQYIGEHRLRVIVNLRGENKNREWYRKEHEIAKKRGAVVIDASLSADAHPKKRDFFILLATIYNPKALLEKPEIAKSSLDDLKKVILDPKASTKDAQGNSIAVGYHCLVGADRTGLAVALRDFERSLRTQPNKRSKRKCVANALKHLTLKFRHFRKLHPKMKETIVRWADIRYNRPLAQALDLYPY